MPKLKPPAPACKACGGTGRNSRGGACHPCEMACRVDRHGNPLPPRPIKPKE